MGGTRMGAVPVGNRNNHVLAAQISGRMVLLETASINTDCLVSRAANRHNYCGSAEDFWLRF